MGISMKKVTKKLQGEVDRFNKKAMVGAPVRYWTGLREGDGVVSKTRTEAMVLSGHTAVVWVEGHPACIALSHVDTL